ncbi:MAG: response regulator [Clostridiales bacterium]|nr:response regulator [Clostridiales bacterium]
MREAKHRKINCRGAAFRAKQIISLLIASVVAMSVLMITCFAQDDVNADNTLRVGLYYTGDNNDVESLKKAHGYDLEYLQALSQYTGWKYEYVTGSWDDCLLRLENGEIDILGFVQKTAEREKVFAYPSLPMAVTSGLLVTGSQYEVGVINKKLKEGIITVGICKGNEFNRDFKEYSSENGYNITYVEYNSLEELSPALEKGEIEAAVISEEDKTATEKILCNFASVDQYFATDKDNTALLRKLDEAMKTVNTYCSDLNTELYRKYFAKSSDGKPVFTTAEQEFIENNPNILVLYDSGWPPVEYLDADGKTYKGISPDIFALLTEKCGINFVYEGSTSGGVLDQLKSGDQRNTLTTISYDYNWAESHDVYITQPFITSNIVKLGKNLNAENPKVAINEKAYFTYLLEDKLAGATRLNFSKQAERLEAVRTGEADYTFVTEDQARYYRSIPKYADLDVERMLGYEQKICISIEKNSDPELMSIISKSLASITHDEMNEIIRKNTVGAYELTLGDRLYRDRVPVIIALLLAVTIIIALTFIGLVRHKNRKNILVAYKQKEEALAFAEQASAAKGNFMSRMSHEIRTPLNAVIGYNLIARNELSDAKNDEERRSAEMKVMDCLTKSDIASRHLLTIINDVLDMSSIESGKIKIEHTRFDFKGLITSLTTIFYSQAKAKGVTLDVVIDKLSDEWFVGDQMRTNQILTNLLSNAIKFTYEGGSVKLTINQSVRENGKSRVHFEVLDTGIGMTEEYLSHIWTPFEQEDSSISRRFGGTGLGLSITKSLVDLMNGEISVESKPGTGTRFTVELDYEKAEKPDDVQPYNFDDINALVVDDDSGTCDYIRLLFNRCGARCATVTSGQDAVVAIEQSLNKNDMFTVCLVDWRMPKMDGIETIKRIRQIVGDKLPIIVLTAYDYSEIADEAAQVGVNRFISKPLFQSSLFDLLANICGVQKVKEIKKNEAYNFNGVRVILAEDNAMNMEIAKKIMESAGVTVDCVWNGSEAVSLFEKSVPGTYSAIFMDVHMPVMNGYEATKQIRASAHKQAKAIPIIAMTADAFVEDIAEAKEAGMNDHISKPIDIPVLFEKLRKYTN